jgi:hypothetical protein
MRFEHTCPGLHSLDNYLYNFINTLCVYASNVAIFQSWQDSLSFLAKISRYILTE